MISAALEATWRAYAATVEKSARRAWFCVPFAVLRARSITVKEMSVAEAFRVHEKYLREVGFVPPLRRLLDDDQWMETVDDPYLPAGLYERSSIHRWLFDRGWPRLSAVFWLWRNRAYGKAAEYRYVHLAGDRFERIGDADPGDEHDPQNRPTHAGESVIVANRTVVSFSARKPPRDRCIAVAFERQRVGFYPDWLCKLIPPLRTRFWHVKEGWKLGDYADGTLPVAPTAAGLLQVRSLRPFQSRVG